MQTAYPNFVIKSVPCKSAFKVVKDRQEDTCCAIVEYDVLACGLSLPNCRVLIALVIRFYMVSFAAVDQSPAQQHYTVSFYSA